MEGKECVEEEGRIDKKASLTFSVATKTDAVGAERQSALQLHLVLEQHVQLPRQRLSALVRRAVHELRKLLLALVKGLEGKGRIMDRKRNMKRIETKMMWDGWSEKAGVSKEDGEGQGSGAGGKEEGERDERKGLTRREKEPREGGQACCGSR
jgi:hypothetical protein